MTKGEYYHIDLNYLFLSIQMCIQTCIFICSDQKVIIAKGRKTKSRNT